MKLTMTRVLTPLAALAFTLGAQATAVSTDGFESYSAGSSVTNATGWSFTAGGDGAPDASAVTAYGEAATPSVLPDGTMAGDNFLKLSTEDGILFRNMDGANGGTVNLYQGLYVDTDVQFTLTDKSDRPTPDSADKFIIWLEADEDAVATNLCVWAREYKAENGALVANSNKVYKLNANSIVPGEWHRLTVKAIAQIDTTTTIPGFQVYLDNTLLASPDDSMFPSDQDEYAACYALASATAQGFADAGTFFPAMADSLSALSKVGFSGEGKIDNLVVTRDLPAFEQPTTLTFTWDSSVISAVEIADLGATLTQSGSTVTVRPGTTFNFTLSYQGDYSASTHTITTGSSTAYATVSDFAVTAVAYGAATIAITATAKNTVDVTFDWSALNTAMGSERVAENDAISFTVGGTVYNVDLEAPDESLTIPGLAIGTNILVTVHYTTPYWVTQITPAECMSLSDSTLTINSRPASGAATVYITTEEVLPAKATVNGVDCATLAEAIALAKNTANPVVLCDDITLEAAEAIASDETVTIDLNGNTITGADNAAAFTNAGTLTITDSSQDHDGSVVAGSNGYVVANTGTLSLVYGSYEGYFTNSGTFTITADCVFGNNLDGVYTPATGYEVAQTYSGSGKYQLKLLTYTITYMNGETELTGLTPATYTVEDAVTLPTPTVEGTFNGWKDSGDNAVAGWVAGGKTGNQKFFADVTQGGSPLNPGQDDGETYNDAQAATNAAAQVTVAATSAVQAALTAAGASESDYLAMFAGKVTDNGDGTYTVTAGLTPLAEETLQASADTAVVTAAASLAGAAVADTSVTVAAQPGFYYSVAAGAEVNSLTEGDRTLASGSTVSLTLPKQTGTKGFYRILVNVAPKSVVE